MWNVGLRAAYDTETGIMMAVETYRAPPRREVDEGGPTEACTLTALPMDAMSRIAGSLSLADAGKLAQTCTTLRACVESPVLRGELLDRWVSCQPRDAGCTKDLLRNLAGPRGDLALLHRLSAWPAGLWVAQSGDQVVESCRLLVCRHHPSSGSFSFTHLAPARGRPPDSSLPWAPVPGQPLWNQLEVGSYSPPDSGAPRWRWLRSQQKSPSLARIRPSGLSLDMVARWPWFQTGFNPLMGEHGRRVAFHRVATHPVSARDLGLGPRFPPPPDAIARMQVWDVGDARGLAACCTTLRAWLSGEGACRHACPAATARPPPPCQQPTPVAPLVPTRPRV